MSRPSRVKEAAFHTIVPKMLRGQVDVALVGCGGNGSQMLTGLARLDRALRAVGHPGGLHVTAYDPDRVTDANIGRQLFSPADVGQYKACVLVHRINVFYATAWDAHPIRYTDRGWGLATGTLLITCVDSAAARREIHGFVHGGGYSKTPDYCLDLGNRQQDGQVVLGQPIRFLHNARGQKNDDVPGRLPTVTEVFPELLDAKLPEDTRPSCSLAEALETQDLFINQAVATVALNLLWRLFRDGRLAHHGAFVNLATGRVNPLPVPVAPTNKRRTSRGE